MKRRYIKFVMMLALAVGVTVAFWSVASANNVSEKGGDHSEAEECASCHPVMAAVKAQWELSEHGNSYDFDDEGNPSGGNTYCASCKSPPLADPLATYMNNDPIDQEDWQDVTCSSCHYEGAPDDPDELCVSCHTGDHHARDFKGFGQAMFDKKEVQCIDCHMPEVPVNLGDDETRDIRSHTWEVEAKYSCGLEDGGCHDNHKENWAEKQINKMKIHDSGGNWDNWPYYPGGDSPP